MNRTELQIFSGFTEAHSGAWTSLLVFCSCTKGMAQFLAARKGRYMERIIFLLFLLYSLLIASHSSMAAESQTWKVRPGDNLDIIATTLEIPKEAVKKMNPGILETNLHIGQKLKLPLRPYVEGKALEEELKKKDSRIEMLESKSGDLEEKFARAEVQLAWYPIWLWGFWIFFGIVGFIAAGLYWICRQTHPRVLERAHDRSVRDLRESQIRVRSSFPLDEEGASRRRGLWQPSLRRLPTHR